MVATPPSRPPRTPSEREALLESLDRHRDAVVASLVGLDDDAARRPLTPSGTNLLGLVKHLASIEYGWFCRTFGHETEPLPTDGTDDLEADMRARPGETVADVLAFHARARAAADAAIAVHALDDLGRSWDGSVVSLRWVLVHVLEDEARHAGHCDIVRELIDGATAS